MAGPLQSTPLPLCQNGRFALQYTYMTKARVSDDGAGIDGLFALICKCCYLHVIFLLLSHDQKMSE